MACSDYWKSSHRLNWVFGNHELNAQHDDFKIARRNETERLTRKEIHALNIHLPAYLAAVAKALSARFADVMQSRVPHGHIGGTTGVASGVGIRNGSWFTTQQQRAGGVKDGTDECLQRSAVRSATLARGNVNTYGNSGTETQSCPDQQYSSSPRSSSSTAIKQSVIATAMVYFRRYYKSHPMVKAKVSGHAVTTNSSLDVAGSVSNAVATPIGIALVCLILALKVEDGPKCTFKDILAVQNQMDIKYNDDCDYGEEELKILEAELLCVLQFDLNIWLPYRQMLKIAQSCGLDDIQDKAWALLNDTLCTDMCIRFHPHIIAIACIFLAGELQKNSAMIANSVPKMSSSSLEDDVHTASMPSDAGNEIVEVKILNDTLPLSKVGSVTKSNTVTNTRAVRSGISLRVCKGQDRKIEGRPTHRRNQTMSDWLFRCVGISQHEVLDAVESLLLVSDAMAPARENHDATTKLNGSMELPSLANVMRKINNLDVQ